MKLRSRGTKPRVENKGRKTSIRESAISRRHRILAPFPWPYANGGSRARRGRAQASNDAADATNGGGWGKKKPFQIFLVQRRGRAALDRRTPLQGHGRPKKNSKQQSTCGRRRVRAAGGLGGVIEVTPYGHVPNDGRAAALDCQKLPPPSPGSKKDPKQLK